MYDYEKWWNYDKTVFQIQLGSQSEEVSFSDWYIECFTLLSRDSRPSSRYSLLSIPILYMCHIINTQLRFVGKIGMQCVNMRSQISEKKIWFSSEICFRFWSATPVFTGTPGSKLGQSTFTIHRLKLFDWGSSVILI